MIVSDLNIPQSSFLITRMLDEMVSLIVSVWEVRDNGVDDIKIKYEGEEPISRLKFVEKHFDPFKHINIQEFMVNIGSYLSELIRTYQLDGIGEFGVLMDFLEQNVDQIHYMGSVINKIEHKKQLDREKHSDFE